MLKKSITNFLLNLHKPINSFLGRVFYTNKWNIGYLSMSRSDFIRQKELGNVNWLTEEESDYSADPFVVTIKCKTYIYYEFLNMWDGKGKIYRIENFDFNTRKPVRRFNDASFHMSYPYLFKDNDAIYFLPETGEANEVTLYKIDPEDSDNIQSIRTLISGAHYLDSSIVKYNQKYWLFTSKKNEPGLLFIFYANSLWDEFVPHILNPISTGLKSYRSAGQVFIENSALYRPTQNLENSYGGSIVINEIKTLSETGYESDFFFEILPKSPYQSGIHTISFEEGLVVVDGKRKIFSLAAPAKKLNNRFKYIRRSLNR